MDCGLSGKWWCSKSSEYEGAKQRVHCGVAFWKGQKSEVCDELVSKSSADCVCTPCLWDVAMGYLLGRTHCKHPKDWAPQAAAWSMESGIQSGVVKVLGSAANSERLVSGKPILVSTWRVLSSYSSWKFGAYRVLPQNLRIAAEFLQVKSSKIVFWDSFHTLVPVCFKHTKIACKCCKWMFTSPIHMVPRGFDPCHILCIYIYVCVCVPSGKINVDPENHQF